MLEAIGFKEGDMSPENRDGSINISGIPVNGIGGLGLVAVAGLMTYVLPATWWFVASGAVGGMLVGIAILAFRRHHVSRGPSGDDPTILFRAAPAVRPEPARSAPGADVAELATV
jgi:hypothetical protein